LGDIRVQAPRTLERSARAFEVAALELDQPEVDERVDEAWAVFERDTEARVGSLEIAAGERLDAGVVEGDRLGGEGGAGRAAGGSE
jgi:hypothetical protein